jgi:hypothetical protein
VGVFREPKVVSSLSSAIVHGSVLMLGWVDSRMSVVIAVVVDTVT